MQADYPVRNGVRVALCETNSMVRSAFQTALFRRGLRDLEVCRDSGSLLAYLDRQLVDLVICANDLPGMDFPIMVQQIRQQAVGRNPFTMILATTGDSTVAEIRQIVNSGVDRVARKPLSMTAMLGYFNGLSAVRKDFVATADYVGPSRRAGLRPDQNDNELTEVPNTLRAKLLDKHLADDLDRAVLAAMDDLQRAREQNSCWAICRSVGKIVLMLRSGAAPERVAAETARLSMLSAAFEHRYRGGAYDHFADIANCLMALLDKSPPGPVLPSLLEKLSAVIHRFGQSDPQTGEIVRDIAATVRRFLDGGDPG